MRGAVCVGLLAAAPAHADDLRSALDAAYQTNPQMLAARETQKATDEGVPIARADGLPSASGTAQETEYIVQNPLSSVGGSRLFALNGTLNVPIYSGGGVRNAVKAAETRVVAGRHDLRGTESQVFSQVVAAYMDVILGEATVRLSQSQVHSLDVNLQSTRDRFQIGDLTRTDVAQSDSRLALARGQLENAQSQLASARERYVQLVGRPPLELQPPPPLPGLPATVGEAVSIALTNNPDLIAARQRSRAAGYDTRSARSAALPRISLFADGARVDYLGSLSVIGLPAGTFPQSGVSADVGIRATIPFYQGGRPAAQVKQAQAREGAALENEIGTERAIVAQVRSAWTSYNAANEIILSSQTAVDASSLSLEGVKAENSVGNRTILDILNAEQELVNAQLQLVTARRNAYVAGFTLLAAMGKAEARALGLDGGPLYDPDIHYRQARGTLWDWGSDPKPVAKSTRTVDTPAQPGTISGGDSSTGSGGSATAASQ
jgi:outer membrane protein